MSTKDFATWSDLPIELAELVLVHLDPQSLLTMAKLNHYLNYLALEIFFGSDAIRSIHMNKLAPPFPHSESLILSGLCIGLWMRNITELEQRIIGDVHQSALHFRKLTAFVERLRSLKSLSLRIYIIPPCWGLRDYRVEGDLLVVELHKLLEVAVGKGCERLQVEGSSIPYCRLSAAGIRTLRSQNAATTKAWKWMKRRLSLPCVWDTCALPSSLPIPDANCPSDLSTLPHSHITTCTLHRPALLGDSALPFIAKLLRRNAETITHLDVNCFGLTRSYWKARGFSLALFNSVHLPHLDTLVLTIQVSTISTSSFAWFLSRHPRISTLKIVDPSTLPDQPFIVPPKHPPLSIPSLKTLSIPARVAEWLFAHMIDEAYTFESVTVSAWGHPDNVEKLSDAIREMRHRRVRMEALTFDVKWRNAFLIDNGFERLRQQDELCLLDVGKLILLGNEGDYSLTSPSQFVGAFVHVVEWFPTVTELEIKGRLDQCEDWDLGQVRKSILERCPHLLSVQLMDGTLYGEVLSVVVELSADISLQRIRGKFLCA
jgi:hypothetical protein